MGSQQTDGSQTGAPDLSITTAVEFRVKGVGTFKAKRLTGRLHMAMYKRRAELLSELAGFAGGAQEYPADVVWSSQVMATLEVINIAPVDLEREGVWHGPLDSQDDVLSKVYTEYFKAKKLVELEDEKVKDDLKN